VTSKIECVRPHNTIVLRISLQHNGRCAAYSGVLGVHPKVREPTRDKGMLGGLNQSGLSIEEQLQHLCFRRHMQKYCMNEVARWCCSQISSPIASPSWRPHQSRLSTPCDLARAFTPRFLSTIIKSRVPHPASELAQKGGDAHLNKLLAGF
jgi:hypothetical protein